MELSGKSSWMVGYMFNLCFVYPRRHSSSTCLPQPFHLQPTHGALSLTPSLLFIRPRTNQRSQPRPKAQGPIYNFGLYPYKYIYRHITRQIGPTKKKYTWIFWFIELFSRSKFFPIYLIQFFFISIFFITIHSIKNLNYKEILSPYLKTFFHLNFNI